MGNGAMAIGLQLPRPSSTLPFRTCRVALTMSVDRGKLTSHMIGAFPFAPLVAPYA